MSDALLEVSGLRVRLPTASGLVTVVDGVDYRIERQQVFGVAGESGSGKTMSVLALMGLLPPGGVVEGEALFEGRDLLRLSKAELRRVSGREIAMVFQDPMTSLHPMLSVGTQLTEHTRRNLGLSRREASARAADLLAQVRLPDPVGALSRFPHQFSGGMRQRIAIAMALTCDPKIIVADEPTTALDVTVQAGILRLLDRLRRESGLTIVLITHDLGVMSSLADTVSIFYAGRVVETGREDGGPAAAAPSVHQRAARRAAASRARRARPARRHPGHAAEPAAAPDRVRLPPALRVRLRALRGGSPGARARGRRQETRVSRRPVPG